LPFTLSGVSKRLIGLPMSVKSLGSFQRRIGGRGNLGACSTSVAIAKPAAARRVDDLPLAAVQLGGIDASIAGLRPLTSMARAVAPALRSGIQKARMELELPVAWMPKTGCHRACRSGARARARDLGIVRVELLGQDHGDRGVDALPHLDLRHDQRRVARRDRCG
jgi:hypothetical protein